MIWIEKIESKDQEAALSRSPPSTSDLLIRVYTVKCQRPHLDFDLYANTSRFHSE